MAYDTHQINIAASMQRRSGIAPSRTDNGSARSALTGGAEGELGDLLLEAEGAVEALPLVEERIEQRVHLWAGQRGPASDEAQHGLQEDLDGTCLAGGLLRRVVLAPQEAASDVGEGDPAADHIQGNAKLW